MAFCTALLCLTAVANRAAATVVEAINFDGTGAVNDGPFAGYVLGWEFTVHSPLTVESLGWFDDGSGFSVSHPVGIFNLSGTLLGSETVLAGDPLVSSVAPQPGAGFRYHAVASPFELAAGTYRIGGLNPAGSTDKNYDFVPALTAAAGVSYVHSYYTASGVLSFPNAFGDREKGYFGPNFQFSGGGGPPPPPPPPPPPVPVDKFPAISVNLASSFGIGGPPPAEVGTNVAGVVRSTDWNDITLAQQTNTPLKSNSGAIVPGLTLSTTQAFTFPGSAYDSGDLMPEPGDKAMMRGHIYLGGANPIDVRIDGTIPYENYDVYVYYNSGGVANTQTFSLLSSDLSQVFASITASEIPGADVAFIEATDSLVNANYVKFSGLNNHDMPNFVLRAHQGTGYNYINGFQIVNAVPEPNSVVLAAFGSVMLVFLAWRKRQCRLAQPAI